MGISIIGVVLADPTFLATAATYAAAVAAGLCAWLLRRGDPGDAGGRYGPSARWADGGGRVDPRPFREFDLVAALWITGIYVWMSLTQIAAKAMAEDDTPHALTTGDLWVSIGMQAFMPAMALLIMAPRLRAVDWLGMRWPGWRMLFALGPLSVAGMWVLFGALQGAGYMRWLESMGVETVQDSVRVLRAGGDAGLVALMAFAAVVVAPLCEEIVFRGYLYGVAKRFCGAFGGALATALVFAAAHASLVALLPLALFGLVLAWLYERTGSIWAPIAAHACFNAATVVIQLVLPT